MLALALFVPVVGIPLLVISVAPYGFGKGFFGYLIKHISKKIINIFKKITVRKGGFLLEKNQMKIIELYDILAKNLTKIKS